MKKNCMILSILIVLILSSLAIDVYASGIDPTFNMTAKNITRYPKPNGQDSIITFELWMQQTNQGQPGVNDFEFCCAQYTFRYNKAIHTPGGNLIFGIVPAQSELPPILRPPSFRVDSLEGYLQASGNIPQSLANFFISGTYPGTRILTFRAVTNGKRFNFEPLNLRFKLDAPFNTFAAYLLPYPDSVDSELNPNQFAIALLDTVINHYSVEDSNSVIGNIALLTPNYNSSTVKKNIYFSWLKNDSVNSYKLEIASDPVFNNVVYSDSGLTDTFKTVSSLTPGAVYYWHVSGKNDSVYFAFSSTWLFNVGTVQTVLNSPPDDYMYNQLPVTFSWLGTGTATTLKPLILNSKAFDNIMFSEYLREGKFINGDKISENVELSESFDFPSGTTYTLEVAQDINFSTLVYSESSLTDTFKTLNNLNIDSAYYWRVTPVNDSIFVSSSATWKFGTFLSPATLVYPPDNSTNIPLSFVFLWNEVNTALNYSFTLATDSLFTNIVINDSAITDTFRNVSGLDSSTVYYWKVKAYSINSSSISEVWNFNTVAPDTTLTLIFPPDNLTNTALTLNFLWKKVNAASSYRFVLSTDSLLNNVVILDSTVTDTFRNVTGLQHSTDYYWQVKSNTNIISPVWKFTTYIEANDSTPTFNMVLKNIMTRPNFSQNQDSILTFEIWMQQTNQGMPGIHDLEYASGQFTFRYNKEIQRPGENLSFGLVPDECALPPNLRPPSFQVDSLNGYLKSSSPLPVPTNNFFISGTFPGTRILTFKLVTDRRRFEFRPINLSYKLGASPNTFVAYYLPYPFGVDSLQFPNQTLMPLYDTLVNHYLVENPIYILPVELTSFNSNTERDRVSLNWTTSHETNNSGFVIERSQVNGEWIYAGAVAGSGNSNSIRNYSFSEKVQTGKYRYRLKQIDYNGSFEYFDLSEEVVVGIPSQYRLSQNYPNPFNPSTKIDFELPSESNVSLVVYDLSGKELAVLVNESRQAGYYTTDFNASGLSSGIYFYVLKAGNFKMTKKMAVVK